MTDGATPALRVLVVDDDDLVRRVLLDYLRIAQDLRVVAACPDAPTALAVLDAEPVDVVLMDVHMPGMDGVAATRAILAAHPGTRVVVLTSMDHDQVIGEVLGAGACGYLLKSISPEALVSAVRGAARGVSVMSSGPMARLRPSSPPPATHPPADLSERELEIVRHLCEGLSNAEMAERMFLSESSVKGYVTTVMRKLGVTTRLKAVVRAHDMGLDRV